jgi:hypothetical protein
VDDYARDADMRNDWSFLFTVHWDAERRRCAALELTPLFLDFCRTEVAAEPDAGAMRRRMVRLSRELGTELAEEATRGKLGRRKLWWRPAAAGGQGSGQTQ